MVKLGKSTLFVFDYFAMLGYYNFAACIILGKCGVISWCKRPKNAAMCGCNKIEQCVLPDVTMV